MKDTEKKHWFCFSYRGYNLDDGLTCDASTYTGYNHKNITLKAIKENKVHAGVRDSAVLISVSYLGYMNKEEIMG